MPIQAAIVLPVERLTFKLKNFLLPFNNSIAAEKMTKNSTSFSKTVPGNLNKSKLPIKAPLKINAAVFVIFAITGSAPAISKAGYETSDA